MLLTSSVKVELLINAHAQWHFVRIYVSLGVSPEKEQRFSDVVPWSRSIRQEQRVHK